MKQTRLLRIISFIVAFIMLLEIGPIHAFAIERSPEEETPDIPMPEIIEEAISEIPAVYIEGEVPELRNEYEKHYRLTDGSYMAVQYQVPVHYENGGQWEDIDNTLEPVTMFSGGTVYQAVNGENVQAFASDLSNGTIMTMATDDHMISMSIWTYDSVEEAVIEDEPENSVDAEDDAVVTEPMATQEAIPAESADSAEATVASNPDTNLVGDVALAEEEWADMAEFSLDATENVQEDATIEDQQDDTIVAQILTEEVGENPVADTEETEPWELDDVMPDALSSSILYEDVFPGVDLRYDTFSYNVKESIILKQPMDLDEYTYSFLLTLDGLEPELQDDGSILLFDDAYEIQYTIPAPYMWDSENVFSGSVFYELEENDNGWVLTVCADESWLEDEERSYPVIIDPSVNIKSNIRYTTSVQSGTPNSNSNPARPAQMSCGYSTTFAQMNGYVQLTVLPELPVGSTVTSAKLYPRSAKHWLDAPCRMDIYMLTSALNESYWSSSIPWNGQPTPEEAAAAMDFIIASQKENVNFAPTSWDITPAFMEWMDNPASNFGLKLVGHPDRSNESSWVRFDSTATYIAVTYRNTVGIESYYTYETQSAVRAGTGYVSDFSSALTVLKTDVSYSSATIPFSVTHVYNSDLAGKEISAYREDEGILAADYSKMETGNGWQLSVQESVVQKTINNIKRQVYRDSDGTLHYFNWMKQSTYVDEDGLGLTLRQYADGGDKDRSYEIKDQQGNIRFFRNNMISYIADANGNRIYFLYNGEEYSASSTAWHPKADTSSRLTEIIAINKGKEQSLICQFTYDDDRLSSITDYAGRVTQYIYDDAGNLIRIIHPDNTEAIYTYDSATGHLIGMCDDEASYGIEYSYIGDGVATIQEYSLDENDNKVVGTKVTREKPSIQETVYRYDGNDRAFGTADDIVNRYTFDYAGRTINAVTLDSAEDRILGVSAAAYKASSEEEPAANNRISKSGQSGQNGVNLLKGAGIEYTNSYTAESDWFSITNNLSGYTGGFSTTIFRTGKKAMTTAIASTATPNNGDNRRAGMYQTVDLVADTTYTFSAYVNTGDVTNFPNGSVYAAFLSPNNSILESGNKITYKTDTEIDNGWQRIYCTFKPTVNIDNCRVAVIQENAFGAVYYDDLQLEIGNAPSTVNLLQNATFDFNNHWVLNTADYADGEELHLKVLSLEGDPDDNVRAMQRVEIGQVCTDQTFLLSGWGKAASAADCETQFNWDSWNSISSDHGKRYFGLIAKCHYTHDNDEYTYTDYHFMPFNDDYDGWQFASCVIVPESYYQQEQMVLEYIDVYVVYDNNFNIMYVDNLSLRQEPCTTYTYNALGNIVSIGATGNESQAVKYVEDDDVRPATVWKSPSEVYYYQYYEDNKYLPTYINNAKSLVYTEYDYDSVGNLKSTTIGKFNDKGIATSYPKLKSTAEYSTDGSQLKEETNANGQTTRYEYNARRNLVKTIDEAGTEVISIENTLNNRPHSSYINGTVSVGYSYDRGLLSRITRGGFITGNAVKQNQFYNMTYDSFGNMTMVSIGGTDEEAADTIVLASYDYGEQNGHLNSMTYGESDSGRTSISYTYDELDRLIKETWSDGTSYQYFYNSEGALIEKVNSTVQSKVDNGTADVVDYEYDSIGRLIHSSASKEGVTTMLTEHMYDRQNRIKEQTYQLNDGQGNYTTYISNYTYRDSDGAISYVDSVNGNYGDYAFEYDDIARLSARYNYYFRQDYEYLYVNEDGETVTDVTSQTSTQIDRIDYTARSGGTQFSPFSLTYTYDNLGNIKTINGTGITGQNAAYEYDIQGQLTAATINGKDYAYEYDTYGNIREAVKDGVTHTYSYDNPDWKDLLTAYNGVPIIYEGQFFDADSNVYGTVLSGNPVFYYNGSQWNFSWSKGRQLVSAIGSKNISYTYDMAGIRDSKTVNGVRYDFLTLDGKVVRQTWNNKTLDIIYDNSGLPYAFKYAGGYYIYVLNQQGDVIRIVNNTGATVAEYTYDAWGKVLSVTEFTEDSIGAVNPIRYRGYYYDTETGFYYLQSRYYDPSIGRFINADTFASTGQGFLGNNMFAYCRNNPVCRIDISGAADADCFDDDPLDEEDILKSSQGGGNSFDAQQAILDGDFTGSYSNDVPQKAWDMLNYLKSHKWHPPHNYKGGKEYKNDGRDNSEILPDYGTKYYEFDINPKIKHVDRGDERIVTTKNGITWYTPAHYRSFIRME